MRIVPSRSGHPLTNMTFGPHGVEVSADSCESAVLGWDDYGQVDFVMDTKLGRDGWVITDWGSRFGVAVWVSGAYVGTTRPIDVATSTAWRRYIRWSSGPSLVGRSLPVLPGTTAFTAYESERATLGALCLIVHDDVSLRQRLGDATRMTSLAQELTAGVQKFSNGATGAGWDSTDIHVAMRQAGFVHRHIRPLTAHGLPSLDQVMAEVEARLRSNPYRRDRAVDRNQVERIVRRDFLDVKPWPFASLVDD